MSADGPLFHKYNLSRTDGKPMGDAFVLELKDPYAADALVAYADACEVTHPELAESMREQYGIRRAAKDETMQTMRDQVRDTCTRAEKAEAERNRLRDALSAALEWAGPMGEAPVKARPEWFDKARNALAVTPTPATGSDQPDSVCKESDGCPTEKAVLQRFWRAQVNPRNTNTQQAQVVGEAELDAKAKAMFDAQKDPLAAPWERQWSETIKYWREKAATPQSSAPVVDEAMVERICDAAFMDCSESNRADLRKIIRNAALGKGATK